MELKKRFWVCCWSTYKEEFEDNLKLLGDLSKKAAEDFVAYNPNAFCRAFFSCRSKSAIVDNNLCESFNASILDARHKPIVAMLDEMRGSAMKRLASNKEDVEKWKSEWSPSCLKTYQDSLEGAYGCMVLFNGADGYEVGDRDDRHTLYLDKRLCTCRKWDLTGIPCSHAICALKHAKRDPQSYISHWYHKSKYIACYKHVMQPMGGKQFMKCTKFPQIEPPPIMSLPGRPRKVRIRGSHEVRRGKTSGKLSRKEVKLHCTICRSTNHNRTKCPNISKTQGSSIENKTFSRARAKAFEQPLGTQKTNQRVTGIGIYVDEATGNMTLNPGFPSETVVRQEHPTENQVLSFNPDPRVTYPIPNERETMQKKAGCKCFEKLCKQKDCFSWRGNTIGCTY